MSEYRLPRDTAESHRLDAQHLIYEATLGYLLHPSIPVQEPLRLIDIGCGTGSFIIALAAVYPQAEFVGYDISSEQFPERSTLPSNVMLRTHSILEPFPNPVEGTFDIATLRLVGQAIPVDQRQQAIENVIRLVRVGGYIQWIEPDHLEEAQVIGDTVDTSRISQLYDWSKRNAEAIGWKIETDFALELRRLLGGSARVQTVREEQVPVNWSSDFTIRSVLIDNIIGIFRVALEGWAKQGSGMSDRELKISSMGQAHDMLQEAEAELRSNKAAYVYWIHVVVARLVR